jgi:hypothetical protein
VKQLGKEIRDEEGIGEDECPDGNPLKIDLYPTYPF